MFEVISLNDQSIDFSLYITFLYSVPPSYPLSLLLLQLMNPFFEIRQSFSQLFEMAAKYLSLLPLGNNFLLYFTNLIVLYYGLSFQDLNFFMQEAQLPIQFCAELQIVLMVALKITLALFQPSYFCLHALQLFQLVLNFLQFTSPKLYLFFNLKISCSQFSSNLFLLSDDRSQFVILALHLYNLFGKQLTIVSIPLVRILLIFRCYLHNNVALESRKPTGWVLTSLWESIYIIEMIRVSIGRCFFALIKANKPLTSHNVTARQIDTCRNILAMPPCQHSDLKLKAEAYLKERAKIPSPRISAPTIYNSWQHSNPLQCEIAVLSFSKTMSASQDQYLRKVIEQWADFIFQENQKFKGKKGSLAERESFRAVLIEFFEALNSLCYLLDMDGLMINTYLRIYDLARGWKVEDKSYSHLRYVLDQLLKLEKIPQNYLQFMVSFTSRYPLQSVYHQKEKEIIGLIHKSLPQLGRQKRSHHQLLMNVLHNITILSDVPGNMKSLALNIYQNFSSYNLRLKAFCTLIDIFVIDAKNIAKYLPVIRIFLTQLANIAFKQLPLLFYRADIWLPEFWLPYFKYVSTGDNYKLLDKYHHFVIDDLLAEGGIGGKDIQEAALKFRQVLREKGIVIREFDLRKEYERSYGRIKDNKSSCQMHVANSMRLICSSQILTQVPIKYFMVDVLIDQRVVVEINNSQHYKTVDGKAFLNLKSQFRQRVLQRNGYKYYNIRVDDFASSNFSMLQDIYAIVDSTKSLPNIKKQ